MQSVPIPRRPAERGPRPARPWCLNQCLNPSGCERRLIFTCTRALELYFTGKVFIRDTEDTGAGVARTHRCKFNTAQGPLDPHFTHHQRRRILIVCVSFDDGLASYHRTRDTLPRRALCAVADEHPGLRRCTVERI